MVFWRCNRWRCPLQIVDRRGRRTFLNKVGAAKVDLKLHRSGRLRLSNGLAYADFLLDKLSELSGDEPGLIAGIPKKSPLQADFACFYASVEAG